LYIIFGHLDTEAGRVPLPPPVPSGKFPRSDRITNSLRRSTVTSVLSLPSASAVRACKWRRYVPPKLQAVSETNGVTNLKTALSMVMVVKPLSSLLHVM
jgi:hypothetical protein